MEIIVKAISDCNLACTYCYEAENNKKHLRMSFNTAEIIIRKFHNYYLSHNPKERLHFIWHGGEPLLLGLPFFKKIIGMQQATIGKSLRWHNTLTTNLTLFNKKSLEFFIKNKPHLDLGFSFDFTGNARVGKNGIPINELVLKNAAQLYKSGLPVGVITLLTKSNIGALDEIYEFIRENEVGVKFHHIRGRVQKKCNKIRLTNKEYIHAVSLLIEKWWQDKKAIGEIGNATLIMEKILNVNSQPLCCYEKNCQENSITIKTEGTVLPCDYCSSLQKYKYGDIKSDSLEQILGSPVRQLWAERHNNIHKIACKGCNVLQYCEGGCPSQAICYGGNVLDKDAFCEINYALINLVKTLLEKAGLIDKTGQVNLSALKSFHSNLPNTKRLLKIIIGHTLECIN